MWIFISGISSTATRKDLNNLLGWGVRSRWFHLPLPTKSRIKQCEILQITNRTNNQIRRYGLALIEPDKSARIAIDYLNNARVKNMEFQAHPFIRRSPYRERRQRFCNLNVLGDRERRRHDRRHAHLSSRVLQATKVERMLGIKQIQS